MAKDIDEAAHLLSDRDPVESFLLQVPANASMTDIAHEICLCPYTCLRARARFLSILPFWKLSWCDCEFIPHWETDSSHLLVPIFYQRLVDRANSCWRRTLAGFASDAFQIILLRSTWVGLRRNFCSALCVGCSSLSAELETRSGHT